MFSPSSDEAITSEAKSGSGRLFGIIAIIIVIIAVGVGIFFFVTNSGSGDTTRVAGDPNNAKSYRALARIELRAAANQASPLIVTLREGTTVSGEPAGNRDGVDWLQITAVDGTKGFAPRTLLKELGPVTASTEIRGGTRRFVTSATVNLRETPSMSGKILGVAEGGTRLVSDGAVQSEGEDWFRVPLDGQTTVFVMQRFTTSDDDNSSGEGIEGDAQAALGVRAFASKIANVQATPMPDARIVRALQLDEEVRVIGQTNAGQAWYVLRLTDGSQGFAPRSAIRLDPNASRWVYPDGSVAPGPNIPKGATSPIVIGASKGAPAQRPRSDNGTKASPTTANETKGSPRDSTPVPVPTEQQPKAAPVLVQPVDVAPVPGPQ